MEQKSWKIEEMGKIILIGDVTIFPRNAQVMRSNKNKAIKHSKDTIYQWEMLHIFSKKSVNSY